MRSEIFLGIRFEFPPRIRSDNPTGIDFYIPSRFFSEILSGVLKLLQEFRDNSRNTFSEGTFREMTEWTL